MQDAAKTGPESYNRRIKSSTKPRKQTNDMPVAESHRYRALKIAERNLQASIGSKLPRSRTPILEVDGDSLICNGFIVKLLVPFRINSFDARQSVRDTELGARRSKRKARHLKDGLGDQARVGKKACITTVRPRYRETRFSTRRFDFSTKRG